MTYGGLSMKPVSIPTGLFIFKDIIARGFWLSGTLEHVSDRGRQVAVGEERGMDVLCLQKLRLDSS